MSPAIRFLALDFETLTTNRLSACEVGAVIGEWHGSGAGRLLTARPEPFCLPANR